MTRRIPTRRPDRCATSGPPKLRAVETYWYLRLVEGTPHIADLYRDLFQSTTDRLAALGLDAPALKDIAATRWRSPAAWTP